MAINDIGVFTPDQARILWQDYQTRRQLNPQVSQNYTTRRVIDEVSPHRVLVSNTEAEAIPAYACLRVTGVAVVGGQTTLTVEKPSATTGEFVFNSQFTIAAGAVGWAYRYGIVTMLGDGNAPASPNMAFRPMEDAWTIEAGDGPFVVFGQNSVSTDALIGRFTGESASVNVIHGIIVGSLGCGYYEVKLSEWAGETPDQQSGDEQNECDACGFLVAENSADACETTHTLPEFEQNEDEDTPHIVRRQTSGTDTVVLAFHRGSRFVPLQIWSDCLMVNIGDENPIVSGEGSGDNEPVYQIIDGTQEHIVQYIERWECCDGVDKMVGRTAVVFPGVTCAEEICAECTEYE